MKLIDPDTFESYQPFRESNGLVSTCASEIQIEPVDWLWAGRLARGKHTCTAGEPGTSKSTLSMFIAATVSTTGAWPCGEGYSPLGSVIILSAEDGAADTIVPRLHVAGADLGRVHIVSAVREAGERRAFNLQRDLALLEEEVSRIGDVALIIIDPVSSYLGGADSHKNAEVRGVLEPISEFAERKRVAVLSITHFCKAGAGSTTKALHRFIGSIAFVGAPRIALAVIEEAETDRRLLLHAKNNLAPPPAGLAYRIKEKLVGRTGEAVAAPYVAWDEQHVTMTANEALASEASTDRGSTLAEAKEFLEELLAEGPVPSTQVQADAEAFGLSWSTVKRAKARLKIKAQKSGLKDGWLWSLSRRGSTSEEAHVSKMSPFGISAVSDEPLRDFSKRTNNHPETVEKAEEVQTPVMSLFGTDEHLRDPDAFEERAACLQYDAGLSRAEAEAQAAEELYPDLPDFLDRRRRAQA
jgi:putative DNA primase/helicase